MKAFITRHRKLLIAGILIAAALGVFFYAAARLRKAGQELAEAINQPETALVERRTLVNTISATGKVTGMEEKEVTVPLSGIDVESVNVEVGDYVQAGDLICMLSTEDIEQNLEDARASLNASSERSQLDISAAERSLQEAQQVRNIDAERADQDVASAWEDYQDALSSLQDAEKAYNDAKTASSEAKKAYEEYQGSASVSSGDAEGAVLLLRYNSAMQTESACKTAYDSASTAADTRLDAYYQQVRAKDDSARNNETTVNTRSDSLTTARLSASTSGLTSEQQIRQYEKQLEQCTVSAPISGIITAVNVDPGDVYNGSILATIENADAFQVSAQIDEYDIGKIKEGQSVVIKTNGTGEEELSGVVTWIAPKATAGGAEVTYEVLVSIETENELLKLDMTAKLNIILEESENVLTVPYASVQEDENGEYYVEAVTADGQTRRIAVTKGLESDYYTEISGSEIEEGMEVIVPRTENTGTTLQELLENRGAMGGF